MRLGCQVDWTRICQVKFTALWVTCLVAGCAAPGARAPERAADAWALRLEAAVVYARSGCALALTRYRPARAASDALVVVAPGFMRSRDHLRGLALSLAGAGFQVALVERCRATGLRGRHAQDGFDLMRVADRLGARRVLYLGFSAGALAALVAARNDARALGVVTLDLVDAQDIGRQAARGLRQPLVGLAGAPSACNAHGNGARVVAAAPLGRLVPIPGADHCAFESPTDGLCRALCGGEPAASAAARQRILTAATAAVAALMPRDRGSPDPGG